MNHDLNLLRTLAMLLKYRSTVDVARRLGKTQSAISKSLTKLRKDFDDELLIRSGAGMELTETAERLASPLGELLQDLDELYSPSVFDPNSFNGTIQISATGEIQHIYGARICHNIMEQAPNALIKMLHWTSLSEQLLIENEINAGIHYSVDRRTKQLSEKPLKTEPLAFAVREGHPFNNAEASSDLFDYQSMVLRIPGVNDYATLFADALIERFPNMRPPMELENIGLIHQLLLKHDSFAISAKSSAQYLTGIRMISPPSDMNIEMKLVMVYRNGLRNSPMTNWLFKIIRNAVNFQP